MYGVLNKVYLRNFFTICVTFRDESNEPNSTIIIYNDATVTEFNHPLIMRSNASLSTVWLQYHSCGINFIIGFHLIPLISGKKTRKLSCKILQGPTKHRLNSHDY